MAKKKKEKRAVGWKEHVALPDLKIKSVIFKDSKKPILDPSIKRKLSVIYKNDVVELSKLLSKDLSAWE